MDISLALGGGGTKGYSHIGVIKVLEHEGFQIKAIAGTSAGGLIGALYLAGFSPEAITKQMAELDQKKLYGHAPGEQPSLLGLSGITEMLTNVLGDLTFADLPIPFAVTAVDLNSGEPVVIKDGSVLEAILATIAIPGILPSRIRGEQLLVDGGVSNPVPVNIVKELCPNVPVIAVVLSQKPGAPSAPAHLQLENESAVIERLTRLKVAQALNIFLRSLDVSSRLLAEMRLEIDNPDVILRPDVADIGILDRVDVEEIVMHGEIATLHELDEIHRVVRWTSRVGKMIGIDKVITRIQGKKTT